MPDSTPILSNDTPSFIKKKTLDVPASILIEIHNSLPLGSEGRKRIKEVITNHGNANDTAHWTRGIIVDGNDNLKANEELYLVAVSRGKQETYLKSVKKQFERLQSDLDILVHYQKNEIAHHNNATTQEQTVLVNVRELSADAEQMKSRTAHVEAFVQKMEVGIEECMTRQNQGIPIVTKLEA
ncbi:hypothetical protein [Flavobacterium sp.]|uniref:hypothetical protein n=1 Tax=Flavobacterium sp. TaxID=239 RepID=UPI00260D0AB2|nr:hypothetical protein [Flavobacterium sp.]